MNCCTYSRRDTSRAENHCFWTSLRRNIYYRFNDLPDSEDIPCIFLLVCAIEGERVVQVVMTGKISLGRHNDIQAFSSIIVVFR